MRPRRLLFAATLALLSSFCWADEAGQDAELKKSVRITLAMKWLHSLSPEEAASASIDAAKAPAQIEIVTEKTVACFRVRAARYDKEDLRSFETLLSQYADFFEVPDWEDKLAKVVDARYGPGASAARSSCVKADPASRACSISKSYEVVGGILLWKLAQCAVEATRDSADVEPTR